MLSTIYKRKVIKHIWWGPCSYYYYYYYWFEFVVRVLFMEPLHLYMQTSIRSWSISCYNTMVIGYIVVNLEISYYIWTIYRPCTASIMQWYLAKVLHHKKSYPLKLREHESFFVRMQCDIVQLHGDCNLLVHAIEQLCIGKKL